MYAELIKSGDYAVAEEKNNGHIILNEEAQCLRLLPVSNLVALNSSASDSTMVPKLLSVPATGIITIHEAMTTTHPQYFLRNLNKTK